MLKNLETRLMSAGEAIVQTLVANGVDTVFGIPGAQTYPIFDALDRAKSSIRTIGTRHEQAAAYMAFGYAKATGRLGVYSVVPGPGVLNTTAALSTAWGASQPVLCVTSQVPRDFLGKGRGALHEIPDQLATLNSLIKWAVRIDNPADAPEIVNEAVRVATSGRPGPVSVEMCWDDLGKSEMVGLLPPAEPDSHPEIGKAELKKAAKMLIAAERPMIFAGSGAQHAASEVLALAEELKAPVTSFRGGRGVVSEDHELGVSSLAGHDLWRECDVLLGIGSRLEMPYMRWSLDMFKAQSEPLAPPHLIRVDIDPEEMERLVPHVPLVADSADGAAALLDAIKGRRTPPDGAVERIQKSKAWAEEKADWVKPHKQYLDVIREVLPRDGFFVEELCQTGFTSNFAYPVLEPRTYVSCGFQGTLGFGFPTALGVKAAHPDKPVVSIIGDGGFMFGVQELSTAAQYNLGVVTVLFNNSTFGNVRRDLRKFYKGRTIATEFHNPDFPALAESCGVAGHRVTSPDELKPVLAAALEKDEPALIEVIIDKTTERSPWRYILMFYDDV